MQMQPLDLTFHGPLKTAYNRECQMHMVNNRGGKVTAFDIVGLLTKAFNRTTNNYSKSNELLSKNY